MIIAIVKAKIISGKQDQLRTIANKLQYEYAIHEEGCEQYESFIDGDTFIMLERWSSQEALDVHLKADHVATYVPQLRECVVGAGFDVQFIKSDDVSFFRM
jgi:quinol monooxygenase YgiN